MEDRLSRARLGRREGTALAALGAILLVTVAWWLLALWPSGPAVPEWLERTRAVCFGVAPGGLPHAGGWMLLIGEPIGMVGFLLFAWGGAVRDGLRALAASGAGRVLLAVSAVFLLGAAHLAGVRVREAHAGSFGPEAFDAQAGAPVRLDREAPPLGLVDQHGDTVHVADFAGKPLVVVFAYAHCQTVCPVIVHDAMQAVLAADSVAPGLAVVTLDPWRDTPARLPHIARMWRLPDSARVLSGSVVDVERVLDAWGIARQRDQSNGEITHPTTAYLVDRAGRLAYVTPSDPAQMAALLRGL
jgi:cytochrome oxidase Cu insertion factor (SCO1/SenC/PrrC family)